MEIEEEVAVSSIIHIRKKKTPVAYDMWNYSPRLGSLGGVIDYWREEAAIWQIETHRKS